MTVKSYLKVDIKAKFDGYIIHQPQPSHICMSSIIMYVKFTHCSFFWVLFDLLPILHQNFVTIIGFVSMRIIKIINK